MSNGTSINAEWIAVDWGSSHLRATAIGATGDVLGCASSDKGMTTLEPNGYEAALLALISDWLPAGRRTPVLCCGMVGSQQGWLETPYRTAPCPPLPDQIDAAAHANDPRIRVLIISGVKQAKPADVMRGEETQIAGLLAIDPDFDGVVCLPGTHSKWVRVSAGEIVGFTTFLTGELFSLLATSSVLRHSLAPSGWDESEFLDGVNSAMSKPELIAARLFSLRAEHLINDLPAVAARSRLSGFLIGLELAATRPYWLGQNVALVCAQDLATAYGAALRAQGLKPMILKADDVTLAGLAKGYHQLVKPTLAA